MTSKIKIKMVTITLTVKELKLIQKSLLNKKMGKSEELIWYSIQEKIERAKKDKT